MILGHVFTNGKEPTEASDAEPVNQRSLEKWASGLCRLPAKEVAPKKARRFESFFLR